MNFKQEKLGILHNSLKAVYTFMGVLNRRFSKGQRKR